MKKQSLGGIAKTQKIRQEYNRNPNLCLFCKNPILVKDGELLTYIKNKKFCNHSCSASYNNSLRQKKEILKKCSNCGELFETYNKKNNYCSSICKTINLSIDFIKMTKKELFERRKNYQSARGSIQTHALKFYKKSDKIQKCCICGYDKFFEVAHIKSVSSFSDDTLIEEINNINNLLALCPNHHWELDNGLLIL